MSKIVSLKPLIYSHDCCSSNIPASETSIVAVIIAAFLMFLLIYVTWRLFYD